jgi:hypothetical protein
MPAAAASQPLSLRWTSTLRVGLETVTIPSAGLSGGG